MNETPFHLMIVGCGGQVGFELAELDWRPWRVTRITRDTLELADNSAISALIGNTRPDMLINAAAYTAVDRAESEADTAFKINAEAPAVMAESMAQHGGLLIHFSTDYVFDGSASRPYRESDPVAPVSVYGESKLAGERAIAESGCDAVILRTNWVYSWRGRNFLKTMLRLGTDHDRIRVVADQCGTPTYAPDLARMTRDIAFILESKRDAEHLGIFHLGNAGETTWYDFAAEIFKRSGHGDICIEPIPTHEYPTPARRPLYSVLDHTRVTQAFAVNPPDWCDGLERCLKRLGPLSGQ